MSMQPWQTSLAYAPLQPAFTRWVDHESHDMSAWVDPEQQVPLITSLTSTVPAAPETQHLARPLWSGAAALGRHRAQALAGALSSLPGP